MQGYETPKRKRNTSYLTGSPERRETDSSIFSGNMGSPNHVIGSGGSAQRRRSVVNDFAKVVPYDFPKIMDDQDGVAALPLKNKPSSSWLELDARSESNDFEGSPTKRNLLENHEFSSEQVISYGQKFHRSLEVFEAWENRYVAIDTCVGVLGIVFTVYAAQREYFFSTDGGASQPKWLECIDLFLSTLPFLISLVLRNYTLSKRMTAMRRLLRDYIAQGIEKTQLALYENSLRNAVRNIVDDLYLVSTQKVEEKMLESFSSLLLEPEERESLENFKTYFKNSFDIASSIKFRWYHGYVMFLCAVFTFVATAMVLFSGLVLRPSHWQELGQFLVFLVTSGITLLSNFLGNETLFPLQDQYKALKNKLDLVMEVESIVKKLSNALKTQLTLQSDIKNVLDHNVCFLEEEKDIESQEVQVRKSLYVPLFFVENVEKEGKKQKLLEQYEIEYASAKTDCSKICRQFEMHYTSILSCSSSNDSIKKNLDDIISQRDFKMSVDLEIFLEKINDVSKFLSSHKTVLHIQTLISKLNLPKFIETLSTLQMHKNEYNRSPKGVAQLY